MFGVNPFAKTKKDSPYCPDCKDWAVTKQLDGMNIWWCLNCKHGVKELKVELPSEGASEDELIDTFEELPELEDVPEKHGSNPMDLDLQKAFETLIKEQEDFEDLIAKAEQKNGKEEKI